MALRLRRGTNADRLTVTPAEGELLYTTDSKKIYAGDGSTVGGNIVSGINNLLEDLTPQLGGDLDLNSKSLVGNGNIDITGSITAPSFTGDFYGSVFGDDSELLVDVINSKIVLSNNILADLSDVQVTGIQSGQVLKWNGNNWYGATDSQVNLSAESLNSLGDVNVDGVQLGQVLAWGGSEWTSSELNLSQLADVNTNNAVQGYSLIFDGVNWQAGQVPVPDINNIRIDDLANVSAANPSNNNVLTYNLVTNNWENKSLTLDDITDINLTGLQLGDILSWDGFNWVPDGGIDAIRETDIQGSVYAIDSSVMLDADNNTLNASSVTVSNTIQTNYFTTNYFTQTVEGEIVVANLLRTDPSIPSSSTEVSKFNHGIKINNVDTVYWVNSYAEEQMVFLPSPGGVRNYGQFFKIWDNGKVMINGDTGISGFDDLAAEPDSQLDIYGIMKLAPQTAAPTSPVEGMIAIADRVTWDPASKGSGNSYPVYFDGTAWNAFY